MPNTITSLLLHMCACNGVITHVVTTHNISIAVLSTSAGVAMLAVIILLVVTNITIPAILVCVCVVRNKTGERQAAAPADLKACAAYGMFDLKPSTTHPNPQSGGDPEYQTISS